MNRKVSDQIIEFIQKNCELSGHELKDRIKETFGEDISVPTVYRYLRKFKKYTDEETSRIGSEIQKTITERVRSNTDPFLTIMEDEIRKLYDIIHDKSDEYVIPPDKSYILNPELVPRSKSHYWLLRYEAQLFEAIKLYLSLRPDNIEIDVNIKDKTDTIDEILDEYFNDQE